MTKVQVQAPTLLILGLAGTVTTTCASTVTPFAIGMLPLFVKPVPVMVTTVLFAPDDGVRVIAGAISTLLLNVGVFKPLPQGELFIVSNCILSSVV
jgi:hypothetical protein